MFALSFYSTIYFFFLNTTIEEPLILSLHKNKNSMKNTFFPLIHIIYRSWLSIFIFDSIKNKNMTTVLLANPFIIKKKPLSFFFINY